MNHNSIQEESNHEHSTVNTDCQDDYPLSREEEPLEHSFNLLDGQIQGEEAFEYPIFEYSVNIGNGSLNSWDDGSTQPSSQLQFEGTSQNDPGLWPIEMRSLSSIAACLGGFDEEESLDSIRELLLYLDYRLEQNPQNNEVETFSLSSTAACSGCFDEEESSNPIKEILLCLENGLAQNPQDNEDLDLASWEFEA